MSLKINNQPPTHAYTLSLFWGVLISELPRYHCLYNYLGVVIFNVYSSYANVSAFLKLIEDITLDCTEVQANLAMIVSAHMYSALAIVK